MDVAASQPQWGLLISQYPQACQSKELIFQLLMQFSHLCTAVTITEFLSNPQHPHVALSRRMLSVGRSSACHITFADPLVPSELCRIHVSLVVDCVILLCTLVLLRQRLNSKLPGCLGGGKVLAAQGVAALRVQLPSAVTQRPHVAEEREGDRQRLSCLHVKASDLPLFRHLTFRCMFAGHTPGRRRVDTDCQHMLLVCIQAQRRPAADSCSGLSCRASKGRHRCPFDSLGAIASLHANRA